MIIDFKQEGFLFNKSDTKGAPNAAEGAEEITLLQNIAISHCMFVKDAEELTDKKMTGERRGKYSWSKEVDPLPEYYMFLQIGRAFGPDSRYFYTQQSFFELHKNIRRELLQTVFRDYLKMETIDTLPHKDSMKIYNAEASIFLNFPILTSLFESKQRITCKSVWIDILNQSSYRSF